MAGGPVNEHIIRQVIEQIASTPASTAGTSATGRPLSASHRLERLAELEELARAPVPRVCADSSSGISRRAALPARIATPQTLADLAKEFNESMRPLNVWMSLLRAEQEREKTLGWEHRLWKNPDKMVQSALRMLKINQKALQTLATLKQRGWTPADADTDTREGTLSQLLATTAETGVVARQAMLQDIYKQSQAHLAERSAAAAAEATSAPANDPTDSVEEPRQTVRKSPSDETASCAWTQLQQEPDKVRGWLGEIEQFRAALDDVSRRFKDPTTSIEVRKMLEAGQPVVIYNQRRCCTARQILLGIIAAASATRFQKLTEQMGLPGLTARADELLETWNYRKEEVADALAALGSLGAPQAEPPDAQALQALAVHHAVIEEYAERLDLVGLNLCMDAAARIEMDDNSGLWQSMLDVAHALSDYMESLRELRKAAGGVATRLGAGSEARTSTSSQSPAAPTPSPATSSGRSKPRHRKHGKRPTGPSLPTQAPVSQDLRTQIQKKADALLKSCRVDHETAARFGGDIVAIAHKLGEDTRAVERELNAPQFDAVKTADFVRASARRWFGEMGPLRSVKASLLTDDDRIGPLTDRLEALKLIEQHMEDLEADGLKRDAHPRSNHLSRLLPGREVQQVGAPVRLASVGDHDHMGTLFEMQIQPRALTKGQRAAPWYVHLHTQKLVTAQALAKMAFRDFTAVHLKTEREKNLGARWEAVMRALGYTDAKVHRAAIGPELLKKLFALAQPM